MEGHTVESGTYQVPVRGSANLVREVREDLSETVTLMSRSNEKIKGGWGRGERSNQAEEKHAQRLYG